MEDNEFCRICGDGVLYGYGVICGACKAKLVADRAKPCVHDWEEFKGEGYTADVYVCRNCGERRSVTGQRLGEGM